MTERLAFPSDAFPAFPHLSVEKPGGWVGLAATGLPLALAKDVEPGVFRPNVLVNLQRMGIDFSADAAVSQLNAKLKKLTRFKEKSRSVIDGEFGEEVIVDGRFAGTRGEMFTHCVRVIVIKREYVYDVVEITGTASALTGDNGLQEIREIVLSVIPQVSP